MKLLKPTWVNHGGSAIYSIDIHPDNKKVATGGLEYENGKIFLWNMNPIIDEEMENDSTIPKILCQMDNHTACVNSVRWSNFGNYLASGGDDKIIIIWKKVSKNIPNKLMTKHTENWKTHHILSGHSGDVLDLAWSPHDVYLASASIDNSIIIWNAFNVFQILTIIRGHSGLVKGVTWDPTGKYLASQSDDKSVKVWSSKDWKQVTEIVKPFQECSGTTQVLRLGWSPDGHYIVTAHAMNNAGPTAQIIERNGWKCNMDFVGHRKAVTCTRFNPNILMKRIRTDNVKPQQYSVCALGSKDKSISIWMTALKRPLVVIHKMFDQAIMDVSWSSDGKSLMACSLDGTVCYIKFDTNEIGKPLSEPERISMQKKIYGDEWDILDPNTLNLPNRSHKDSDSDIIEESAQSAFTDKQKHTNKSTKKNKSLYSPPTDRQLETILPNGKKRITPMFLTDSDILCTESTFQTFTSTTNNKSCLKIEKIPFSHVKSTKLQDEKYSSSNISNELPSQKMINEKTLLPKIMHKQIDPPLSKDIIYARIKTSHTPPLLIEIKNEKIKLTSIMLTKSNQSYIISVNAYREVCSFFQDKETGREMIWKNSFAFPHPVLGAIANNHVLVLNLGLLSAILLLSPKSGQKLMPPLILPSPVATMYKGCDKIAVITIHGQLWVWRTQAYIFEPLHSCILSNVSVTPIETDSGRLTSIDLDNAHHGPIIHFDSGNSYMYNQKMNVWLLYKQSNDVLTILYQEIYGDTESLLNNDDIIDSINTPKLSSIEKINIRGILERKQDCATVYECLNDTTGYQYLRYLQNQFLDCMIKSENQGGDDNNCQGTNYEASYQRLLKHIVDSDFKSELNEIVTSLKSFSDSQYFSKNLIKITEDIMINNVTTKPWLQQFLDLLRL